MEKPVLFRLVFPAICFLCGAAAAADAPEAATQAAKVEKSDRTEKVDKSRYDLFNPVPEDQMRDMDTDRPDKTNTPSTIDAGHFQLETGLVDYSLDRDRQTRATSWTFGQPNLRFGVLNDLELNLSFYSYTAQRTEDRTDGQVSHQRGFGDTVAGAKYNFFGNDGEEHPLKMGLAIQPQFKIPTARDGLGNGRPELITNILFSLQLPLDFGLGLQTAPGWERNSADTGYVTSLANSITVDHSVVKNLDAFLEFWNRVTTEKHQKGQSTLDMGVIYKLTPNLALDTAVNLGLNSASRRVEGLLGISVRF